MSDTYTLANQAMKEKGAADAADLRTRAADLDGTAVIAEEEKVPDFVAGKDYSGWPAGAPVRDGEQVYKLLQPYDAASWPDQRPADLPALWSICHTKDPLKAKPWQAPNGTSGMYMTGECCTEGGHVWKSTMDDNVWAPSGYPQGWTDLGEVGTAEPLPEEPETGGETQEPDEPTPEPEPEEPEGAVYPEFVQPTGAEDAYNTGAMVTYNGKVYQSLIDGNVWSPADYPQGWQEVET